MSGCQIQSILNTLGAKDANDLGLYCKERWNKDNNYSLTNNQKCVVFTDNYPTYPKGSVFTCRDGSIVERPAPAPQPAPTPTPQPPASDIPPALQPPAPESNNMTMIMIIVVLLLFGGIGAFFFMKPRKGPSPMTAFGKKLAKIIKI